MLCILQNVKFETILLVILFFSTVTNGALLPSASLNLLEIHLVSCLTYISHRYFAPGRSLVISSPGIYRHVQQELIAEIHRTSIWPVVVTVDGNISIPKEADFIDRDGNYIILIPDGNISSFKSNIRRLAADQKGLFKRLWNSEARFVVAGANDFSESQQKEIFDYLSGFKIYNCIIVRQAHDVIDKEYNRPIKFNVDTGINLEVYTWFPYQSSDRCTEVNDITLLDIWVVSAQEHFTNNTDLFPRKVSKNLNRCPMKAIVINRKWYLTTNYIEHNFSNGTHVTYINGLEYDLFRLVCKHLNMSIVLVPPPEIYGIDNLILVQKVGVAMVKKKADIFFGGLGRTFLSVPYWDSTNTYFMTNIRWYVPCSVKYPRWSSIFRILSVELWLVLIISIVIAAICITLVGRYSCTSEWQGYKTLTSSLTNVWAVILGVSVSTMPRAPSLRSLFLAWVCFSVAFSTVFQAFLTTFLIDSRYKTPIQNLDELFDSGIGLFYPPGNDFIFDKGDETENSKVKKNRVICPSSDICLDWAKYRKNVSLLLEDYLVEYFYANGEFVGENSEPLLCKLEDGVMSNDGIRMIMFYGDPLLRRVNEIIDRVVEAGIYKYWLSLNMNMIKVTSRRLAIFHPLDGYYSFNLYHMQPAFYLLLMGLCLSILCFIFELFYFFLLGKRI